MLQVITILSIAVLVVIDQLIKLLVLEYLQPIGSLPLIDGILQLRYAENTGAAFGSFSEHTTALSVFTFVAILVAPDVSANRIMELHTVRYCSVETSSIP